MKKTESPDQSLFQGFENLAEGIIVRSREGRIVYMNPSAEHLLGISFGDARSGSIRALLNDPIHADGTRVLRSELPFERVMAQGTPVSNVLLGILNTRGERKWLSVNAGPFMIEAWPTPGIITSFVDVTAERSARQALIRLNSELEQKVAERTRELEVMIRELQAFSTSIGTDFRGPLHGLMGHATILAEDFAASLPPDARASLDRIRVNAQYLSDLIDGLLSLAQVSQLPLDIARIDLDALVRSTAANALTKSDRPIRFEIDRLPRVFGDANLLREGIEQVIENAMHHRGDTDVLHIQISVRREPEGYTLMVTDNGPGLEPLFAKSAFEPIHRRSCCGKRSHGLGLAIVRRVAERHGGRAWFEPSANGTTLCFLIPDAQVAQAA